MKFWRVVLLYLFLGVAGVTLGMCVPIKARAETMTFDMVKPDCATGTVSRKGNDVIIRCGGVVWLTITNANLSCPNLKVTRDSKGNLTVRCP